MCGERGKGEESARQKRGEHHWVGYEQFAADPESSSIALNEARV